MSDALRLFALLVYVGLPALIGAFVGRGDALLDERLDMERLKDTYLKEIEAGFGLPPAAVDNLLEVFLGRRHQFAPPIFKGRWFNHWDSKRALPFINTQFIGEGGYGTVYSFQIYRGYEHPQFGDSKKYAMKEVNLPTGPIVSLNEEATNITKIRDELGNEKHIIKVLKIFRRGDKIHFIFPLAPGNLLDFMRKSHGSISPIPLTRYARTLYGTRPLACRRLWPNFIDHRA
ncbi:hypothetical protein BZA05DRAFT_174319 [Tricharina praecox]|uniref:uncharacterized protein n=1 Tax=Tricharina praecox TaxID=43433 RepID=UPI00221F57C9|nr:uncharacterized protein BZA05DRAFT_174319 [Tricharina praecox]KAI5844332.1 hypothetical protein BZA05DRAFT_174319 [Tricharina praecox]